MNQYSSLLTIILPVVALVAPASSVRAEEPPSAQTSKQSPKQPGDTEGYSLVIDSKLNLLLRNYFEDLQIADRKTRHAWVQSARIGYESGYTQGNMGFGADISLFGATQLDTDRGVANMIYVPPEGSSETKQQWAYLGEYALKAKISGLVVKYGLQSLSNPFLEPYDNRSLPPTYRGLSFEGVPLQNVTFKAGNIDAINVRGADYLQRLSTSYGRTPFNRMVFAGADWESAGKGSASVYVSRAEDIWDQYYVAASRTEVANNGDKWTTSSNAYYTHGQGAKLQGQIDNTSYSLSIAAQRGASTVIFGYQQILGDQFFDFTQETSGIFLANAMGVDFNAPNEKSIQIRYKFDGNSAGITGFKLSVWGVFGSGANGSVEASRRKDPANPMHDLYWKLGQVVSGNHHEFGVKPSYTVQSGKFKNLSAFVSLIVQTVDVSYPSKSFTDVRMAIDFPIKLL